MVPRRVRGWRLTGAVVAALALALTSACNTPGAQWRTPGGSTSGTDSAPLLSALVLSPAANATDVSPAGAVTAELTNGTLESVSLTNTTGKAVQGDFDADKRTWHNSEKLGYNKKYTLAASGIGADGQRHQESRTFTTILPKIQTKPYLRANTTTLLDGGTFGVGQPIIVWFDEPVSDHAAAERTLVVKTQPAVEGSWSWVARDEVHWRPKEYWPSGTSVTVEANVFGEDLGVYTPNKSRGKLYGQEDVSASFTIGPSRIAIADSNTHRMKVYVNGQQVTTVNGKDVTAGIPISMGKTATETGIHGEHFDYRTNSGPHVIIGKDPVVPMSNTDVSPSSPNYYKEIKVKLALRISVSGEFVHLADWNIWAHGKVNTSHGCINVAPTYITWFYDTFGFGDIVDVRNTGKTNLGDGLGDWVIPWDKWVKGSALPQPAPSPSPTLSPSPSPSPAA